MGQGNCVKAPVANLDDARAAIGLLPALIYVDGVITSGVTPVKTAHIVNLRDGVK